MCIDVPPQRAWQMLAAANEWPEWYLNTEGVHIESRGDMLKADGVFSGTTLGLNIDTRVLRVRALLPTHMAGL